VVVADTVPHALPAQSVPLAAPTVQVTPPFAISFVTVAVNSCCAVTKRLAFVGPIETEMLWARTAGVKTDEIQAINSTAFNFRMFFSYLNFVGLRTSR
jgi:hypothetical protein